MTDIEKLRAALAKIAEVASAAVGGNAYSANKGCKLHHRPLTAKELKARAAEFDRDGRPHAIQSAFEVASSSAPQPKVAVHRQGDRWRIEFEIPDATTIRHNGLTVSTLPRPARDERMPRQLDGFIPAH